MQVLPFMLVFHRMSPLVLLFLMLTGDKGHERFLREVAPAPNNGTLNISDMS